METATSSGGSFTYRWIRATTLGWLLGFVLVLVLAMAWDAVGGSAQWMVGIGMGTGVGLLQGRLLRPWLGAIQPWLTTSAAGMGMPFLVHDIGKAVGWETPYSLPFYVVVGSFLTGMLQARLLSRHRAGATSWVAICILGWSSPALLIVIGDLMGSGWGGLLSTTAMFLGGIVVGAVTARALERILGRAAV